MRPLTLLEPGSIFDPLTAISDGKIRIIDAVVEQPGQKEKSPTPKQLSMEFKDSLITLEPESNRKVSAIYTAEYSFTPGNEDQNSSLGNRWCVEAATSISFRRRQETWE
jgi:hypothetical protein